MIKTSNILVRKPDRGLNNLQVRKPTMSRLLLKVRSKEKKSIIFDLFHTKLGAGRQS